MTVHRVLCGLMCLGAAILGIHHAFAGNWLTVTISLLFFLAVWGLGRMEERP